jgi:magnesium transporter
MEQTKLNSRIQHLLKSRDRKALREELSQWEPVDIAELVSEMPDGMQVLVFNALDRDKAMMTFEMLDTGIQKDLLDMLPNRLVALILNDMSPDKRTALLEELSGEVINKHLKYLTQKERAVALKLLGYPENSIGRLMTIDYIAINQEWTVKEVLDYIRENGEVSETLNVFYIVDQKGKLIDDIRVRQLLLADLDERVKDIMDGKYIALTVTDDEEIAINEFKKHNRVEMPVVDSNGLLLGIVTIDDILKLAEDEDTEDIQKLAAVEAFEEPYMEVPIPLMIRKRAIWLVVLFIGELLTATAMAYFEDEIAKAVVLALFVPLIVSSGGNSGSQAATLIIRAMSLGEVKIFDWWRIMKREVISGFFLGLLLGTMGFFRVAIWSSFTGIYGPHWLLVATTVGLSLVGVVMWGTLMGSMLPLILKRLGADPAASSTPFVATLVDVTGLVIYFSIAVLLLTGTLL